VRFPWATHLIIFIRSKRAAVRVMEGISRFITRKLKLKVNQEKSKMKCHGYAIIIIYHGQEQKYDTYRERSHSGTMII
jgi:hypothetical protein